MCIMTQHDNFCWDKSPKQGTEGIWVGFTGGHIVGTYHVLNPETHKISWTKNMTFLNKSYGVQDKVNKPALISISYERSDEEDIKMVSQNNKINNYYDVVSDFYSDNEEEENVFEQEIKDNLKVTPIKSTFGQIFEKFTSFLQGRCK